MIEPATVVAAATGGDAVCAALEALGVRCVFGVPSQHNLALYAALARRGCIRMIGARHEAGAVHAADGYARATGDLGVAITSTGPGTANAMNGLYEAGFASSPVLLITTQVDRIHLGRTRGFIHDADRQLEMLRSVTRRSERVMYGHQIAVTILAVAADIRTGRPQPGAVEIPTDLLSAAVDVGNVVAPDPVRIEPDRDALRRAAGLLSQAKRPLLWLGGGCISAGAADAAHALTERLGAPVVSSLNGRGIVPTDHPLFVGSQTHLPQFRKLLGDADVVLAIGTRFQAVATWFWSLPMPRGLIHVDVDPSVLGKNYPPQVAVVGDAKLAADWLAQELGYTTVDPGFLALAACVRADLAGETERRIGRDHARICDAIDRLAPADRNVVCDATMTGNTWGGLRLPARRPRHFTYSNSLAIGPALPLGIGAAIGSGRKTIIIHGDGGIMLNVGELATAVEANAPVIILVFNDLGYGVLRALQSRAGIPHVAVDLHTPDFTALGAAMGLESRHVDSAEAFEVAFGEAVSRDRPQLIEIDLTRMQEIQL